MKNRAHEIIARTKRKKFSFTSQISRIKEINRKERKKKESLKTESKIEKLDKKIEKAIQEEQQKWESERKKFFKICQKKDRMRFKRKLLSGSYIE